MCGRGLRERTKYVVISNLGYRYSSKNKDDKHCYYENRIFPIEAILKHKQVVCMTRKMLFTISNISFRSRDIQVFKYAN